MSLNKKILAAAILGGLSASAAQAQVVIGQFGTGPGASPALTSAVTYAAEIISPVPSTGTILLATPANQIQSALLYNFSAGEVRHARIECAPHIRIATGAVTLSVPAQGTIGSINGLGSNAIHFSITSAATPNLLVASTTVTVDGTRNITSSTNGTCSFALYDQPSQAAAGGPAGRIVFTGDRPYLAFAPSYTLSVGSAFTNVASVEATPVFSAFDAATSQGATSLVAAARIRAQMGVFTYDLVTTPVTPLTPAGTPITLALLMASTTAINVAGDFSTSLNAGGTGATTAERARVFLSSDNCGTSLASATTLTATNARFDVGATPQVGMSVCQTTRGGGVAIPVASYTIALDPVSLTPTTYAVTPRGPLAFSNIVRDGTELQAPLAQVPAGWVSRMVLTNTGSIDRPYTVSIVGEPGAVFTTSNLTGTVPANGIRVVDVSSMLSGFPVGAPTRAMLNVTVAGPNRQIQGLYQIFNTASGGTSLSNYVMVRPGTN